MAKLGWVGIGILGLLGLYLLAGRGGRDPLDTGRPAVSVGPTAIDGSFTDPVLRGIILGDAQEQRETDRAAVTEKFKPLFDKVNPLIRTASKERQAAQNAIRRRNWSGNHFGRYKVSLPRNRTPQGRAILAAHFAPGRRLAAARNYESRLVGIRRGLTNQRRGLLDLADSNYEITARAV